MIELEDITIHNSELMLMTMAQLDVKHIHTLFHLLNFAKIAPAHMSALGEIYRATNMKAISSTPGHNLKNLGLVEQVGHNGKAIYNLTGKGRKLVKLYKKYTIEA